MYSEVRKIYQTGDKIREIRLSRGYNQEQLAEMASLNRVTIAKYESGKVEPGAQALSRIADALEVTVDQLLGRESTEQEKTDETYKIKTLEARIVSFGMDQLPQEEREKIMNVLQAMYINKPELFKRSEKNET